MSAFKTYNFPTLIAGAYFNGLNITLYSDQAQTVPIDISGSDIKMSLRKGFNLPNDWTFSNNDETEGQIVITDGQAGKFSIIGVNMDVNPGIYFYDLIITLYSGEVKKYLRGQWTFLQKATENG